MRRFEKDADKTINSLKLNIHNKCPRCHGEECSYCEGYGYIYNVLGLETRHKIIDALQKAYNEGIESSAKIAEASSHVCEYPFPPQDEIASAIRKQLGGA